MVTLKTRDYSCKDEELPALCKFAAFSLNRDLADFAAFSPQFNKDYLTGFENGILTASEVAGPQSETQELKIITQGIYATFDILTDSLNHLMGYFALSDLERTISPADFGIKHLRKSIALHDTEGIIQALHTIIGNISKYKAVLMGQGLTDALISRFTDAAATIANDKQKQYTILSNRKNIVQANLVLFNGLFGQLNEILAIGKILYKTADPVKLREYTFSELKKRVRRTVKPTPDVQKVPVTP